MALPLHIDPIEFPAHTKRSRGRTTGPQHRPDHRRLAPTLARTAMLRGEHLVPGGTYVAKAGDSMWVIARALQPRGDLARLMRRFATLNDGLSLHVGQRVYLPS